MGEVWDTITLTDDEEKVMHALSFITDNILKIVMVNNPTESAARMPMARVKYFDQPVPLKSLGEGVNRFLSIALALVRSKGGVLLIDEIENGIHYSVHKDMWKLILREAENSNIQVFCTTHSLDAVKGLKEASEELDYEEVSVIRIESAKDRIRAVCFDRDELAIAADENIEIR